MSTISELVSLASNKSRDDVPYMISSSGVEWKLRDVYTQSLKVAKSLIHLGLIPRHESVSIFTQNSPERVICMLGAIIANSKACGIYFSSTQSTCDYILKDSNSRVLFVDSKERLQIAIKSNVKYIVLLDHCENLIIGAPSRVYTWNQFIEIGTRVRHEILHEYTQSQKRNDCCIVVYTSGTTGNPKGVMLSHDNVIYTAKSNLEHNPVLLECPMRLLSVLPMSHVAPILSDVILPLAVVGIYGKPASVYFSKTTSMSIKDLVIARPTYIFAVPRIWEKIYEEALTLESKFDGFIYRCMKNICYTSHKNKSCLSRFAKSYMKTRIQREIGLDNVKLCLTGGAHVDIETTLNFARFGINLLGSYGMSELSGMQSMPHPHDSMDGYSGIPICGTEAKVDDATSELCFRGRQVALGYMNQDRPFTDEEGWFHSGDVGEIHESGYIKVNGRLDDTIITSYGKKISPIPIESQLCRICDDISEAILVGNNEKYLSLLFTMKPGSNINNIFNCINAYNSDIASNNSEKIHRVCVIRERFTVEGGEITSSNKIRRFNILKKYHNEIKSMYYG
jgi:long-chain-fatty-acid--CoA ligase ACSBG